MKTYACSITVMVTLFLLFSSVGIGVQLDEVRESPGLYEEGYHIRLMKPLISVPQIRERGQIVDIWIRNPAGDEHTPWEAWLVKEYTGGYREEFGMEIMAVEEADHRPGEHNWYLTAVVPEGAREELYDLKISDGTVSTVSIQSVQVRNEITDRFTFVSAPDTHIGYVDGGEPAAVHRFREFVHEMNLIRPDFVTFEGDICDKEPPFWAAQNPPPEYQDEKFFNLLQELEVPAYVVQGNHDYSYVPLWAEPGPEVGIESYQKWINPHLNYTFTYADDYFFVMQNSERPAFPWETPLNPLNTAGLMTMENVTWMEEVLAENMDKRMRFVHMHHPVYPNQIHYDDVRDAFIDAVIEYEVTAVFAGHIHGRRNIFDAHGDSIEGDPTQGERPLHVTSADLVKGTGEYRMIRINGDDIEFLTYDLNGDGERDDRAGIPRGQISVEFSPPNDGTNTQVVATVENNLYESFEDAFVKFKVPSLPPGHEYVVENGTVLEDIDTGEVNIFYVNTDLDMDSTKQVTIRRLHWVDTLTATDMAPTQGRIRGRLPDISQDVDVFFRYRVNGESDWTQVDMGTNTGPWDFSYDVSDLNPLLVYEFKAGVLVGSGADQREILGETFNLVPADISRTTQTWQEWSSYQTMEGLALERNELLLEMMEEEVTFQFTGEKKVFSVEDYTYMHVKMLGAGGGGAVHGGDWTGGTGGDGGLLEATFDVSQFSELHIYVGEGGKTGDGLSASITPGGWGGSHGGATLIDTYVYGSPHAGAGGGSTEIVGVTDDGTEVWLAAADAGGGGGEVEDITMIGIRDRAIGGGGGGAGGLGGQIPEGIEKQPGEDAQTADEGSTPREGQGLGGNGGDADTDHDGEHMAWPGDPGGYQYNELYLLELIEADTGGHTGSGGKTNANDGEHDPFRDGRDGSIHVHLLNLSIDNGIRISEPLSLGSINETTGSLISWDAETPGDSDVKIYTGISTGGEPEEWFEAESGGAIPGLDLIEDFRGKYLWTKQEFILGGSTSPPRLNALSEAIMASTHEMKTMDIHLHDHTDSDGWNFVSFNLMVPDTSLEAILEHTEYGISGNYDRVMYYDASAGSWYSHLTGRPDHFNNLGRWDHTMGIWIRMTADDVLTVEGTAPYQTTITLEPGWNMVGLPSSTEGNHGLPSQISMVGRFHMASPYNIAYEDADGFQFRPGEAYWVRNDAHHAVDWVIEY